MTKAETLDTPVGNGESDDAATVSRAPRRRGVLAAVLSKRGLTGIVLVLLVALPALVVPLFIDFRPDFQHADGPLLAPSSHYLLGTDELGRDLSSRVLYGIRIDLLVGILGVALSALLGTGLALVSAAWRPVDAVVQRVFSVVLAFPGIILGVTIAALLSPGLRAILVTVTAAYTPIFGRVARNSIRAQDALQYVAAAKVVGLSRRTTLLRHILPNILDSLIVQVPLSMATAIFLEGAMSFLGLGIQLPHASLGNILQSSVQYLSVRPVYALGAMVPLAIMLFGLNLVADALNRRLGR